MCAWRDPTCNDASNIQPVVIVEMLNPRRIIYYDPKRLLGVHRCID